MKTGSPSIARCMGVLAVVASAAYWISDVWEAAAGQFTEGQLWLTLVAEACVPVFVLGLSRYRRWDTAGTVAAIGYAAAYVYFTGTVIFALLEHTRDFAELSDDLDPWMTVAGGVMVVCGIGLGVVVTWTRAYPTWTGWALGLGVVLVAATTAAPSLVALAATGVRDLAWAGMGWALASSGSRPPRSHSRRPAARASEVAL